MFVIQKTTFKPRVDHLFFGSKILYWYRFGSTDIRIQYNILPPKVACFFIWVGCSSVVDNSQELPDDSETAELQLLYFLEQHPSKSNSICSQFQQQSNQEYCKKMSQRPHLWEPVSSGTFSKAERRRTQWHSYHTQNISSSTLGSIAKSTDPIVLIVRSVNVILTEFNNTPIYTA